MTLKFYLGLTSFIFSFIAICLNLLIFVPVFRMAFISKQSSVYIIAFFNIISDLIQLFIVCFYLSICIMMDNYFLTGRQGTILNIVIGWFFLNAWYMESLVQIVMAVNRFCIITLKIYDLFTFKFTITTFIFLIAFTSLITTLAQYIYPCCQFVTEHLVFAFMFINPDQKYNYAYTQLVSFDFLCTVVPTVLYASVFYTIRKSKKAAANASSTQQTKDTKFLLQFVFISIFYIFSWVCFEIFPHIVPADKLEIFWLVTMLVILNSSTNSVIFLVCNKEIRKSVFKKEKLSYVVPGSIGTSVKTASA